MRYHSVSAVTQIFIVKFILISKYLPAI
jgi:hypothetical protein